MSLDPYALRAHSYDAQLQDTATRKMYREWHTEVSRAIRKRGVAVRVLAEVGCGTGIATIGWVSKGYRVFGVEKSRAMLAMAKSKSKQVKWLCQDIRQLRLPQRADVITAHFDVFNHLLSQQTLLRAFERIAKSLSPNGLFFFDAMSVQSFEWLKRKGIKPQIRERAYSKQTFKQLLSKTGFNRIRVWTQQSPEWDGKPRRWLFLAQKK